jgi:hypothetical protein
MLVFFSSQNYTPRILNTFNSLFVTFFESKVVTEENCIVKGTVSRKNCKRRVWGVGLGLNKEQLPVFKFFCWAL